MKRKTPIRALAAIACMASMMAMAASSAWAAPITLGPELVEPYAVTGAEAEPLLVVNTIYPGGGSEPFIAPVDGVILHWSVYKASGTFRLAVLRPGALEYTLGRLSNPAQPAASTGVETFATQLPIAAGETIGLEVSPGSTEAIEHGIGGEAVYWKPAPAIGATGPATSQKNDIYGFDAEVLPAPTITALGTTSGPAAGGTAVTISGTDFSHVTGVSFGASPASTYAAGSEGQILAVAPAGSGDVPVTVTTIAGTATSAQKFSYVAPTSPPPATPITTVAPPNPTPPGCKVPALKGKKLKGARKSLAKAHCRVGKITKEKGVTSKSGKVVGQGKKAGANVAAGTKVSVKLG
jgi:hypothetical protein